MNFIKLPTDDFGLLANRLLDNLLPDLFSIQGVNGVYVLLVDREVRERMVLANSLSNGKDGKK